MRTHRVLASVAALLLSVSAAAATRPLYYDRPITKADLEGRTLRELSLMRNTIFARAGQPFRKEWLHRYFTAQPWYAPKGLEESKLSSLDRKNAEVIARYEVSIPRPELVKRFRAVEGKVDRDQIDFEHWYAALSEEDQIERVLLMQAIGIPVDRDAELAGVFTRTPLTNPELLDGLISVKDLADMSRRDLRIARNMVFARRGRPFKTETMRWYFSRLRWYRADPQYTDARLTATDLKNIKLIRSVEESLGGALSEAEAQRDPIIEA